MKPKAHAFLLVILAAALVSSVLPSPALAQDEVPVWLVPFMTSTAVGSINATTVITLSNQGTAFCSTVVEFRNASDSLACTTTIGLGPGQTLEHCSRGLPPQIVGCNATCSPQLVYNEGKAIVGMSSKCKSKIAVDARVYHTDGNDGTVQAIAPVKVIKIGKSNTGD